MSQASPSRNTKLDEFLAAAGDQARSALDALPKVSLDDKRFRFVARLAVRRQGRQEEEKPSAKEAFKEAQKDLEFLRHQAEADPEGLMQEALGYPWFLQSLALVAHRDRGNFEAMLLALRGCGLKDRDVKALERAVNAERRKSRGFRVVDPHSEPVLPTVRSIIPDAPVPEGAVVPMNWRLDMSGVSGERSKGTPDGDTVVIAVPVASAPVVISGRLKDVADKAESVRLAWLRDQGWQSQTAARGAVMNARQVVELAGVGFPVTSNTASEVVEYLAAFEASNLAVLPCTHVSSAMGWQGDGGQLGFLWGHQFLCPEGDRVASLNMDEIAPDNWREDWVAFRGSDRGDEQFAEGLHAAGSFEEWRATVALIAPYPRVALSLYGALVPPLLSVLGAANFGIDWSSSTSQGKTTLLRVAASAWGCPNERAPASALATWDATRVWIERASTVLNALPLILDDTKRAKYPQLVGQTIYDVSNGRGRGRGSPKGMRRSGSWTTVLLSTGEAPATSFTQDGGTHARMLELWGPPWGKADEETAVLVHQVNQGVLSHYGHAGPRFVQYLLRYRNRWEKWREEYQFALSTYTAKAGADPVAGRLAGYFAALDQTAAIAHEALELPWEYQDPIANLWDSLVREASQADRAAAALASVMSWATGHEQEFWGRHSQDKEGTPRQPYPGWAGKWESGENWSEIAFLPHRLSEILKSQGFESEAILRVWRDRNWLTVGDDHARYQKKISIAGNKSWAVVIKREAFEEEADGKSPRGTGGTDGEPQGEP